MAQMKYTYETPKGVAGGLYDLSNYECNSRSIESEDGTVKQGYGVVTGAAAGFGVKLPAAASDKFEGIVIARAHEEDMNGDVVLKKGEVFSILRTGKAWARVDETVTINVNDPVYLIASGEKAGQFTNASGATAIEIKGKFVGANEDGIAPVLLFNA